MALTVAFDTGPLHGAKTGIGFAVEAMRAGLAAIDDVELQAYVLSFRAALPDGVRRLPLPATIAQRSWARFQRPRVDRWLGGADLIHGTNYVVPPSRLPAVVSVYDCWFFHRPGAAHPDVRRAGDVLRSSIAGGAIVHTSSVATEHAMRTLFPGAAIRTIHLGPLLLPAPATTPPIPELAGVPFVLAIGTLERRKNIPTLVRAFGALAATHRELRLVLAGGDGDDAEPVRDAIDALGPDAAKRVLRTGRVDEGARSWLLHHAAALAYPSLDEGFGFPLLDAMQAGTPVVASTAGSIPEVAGDAALLHDPMDVDGLAAGLAAAVSDEATRQRLISAGATRWQSFSWQRCAQELVDLYGRAVRGETDDLR